MFFQYRVVSKRDRLPPSAEPEAAARAAPAAAAGTSGPAFAARGPLGVCVGSSGCLTEGGATDEAMGEDVVDVELEEDEEESYPLSEAGDDALSLASLGPDEATTRAFCLFRIRFCAGCCSPSIKNLGFLGLGSHGTPLMRHS